MYNAFFGLSKSPFNLTPDPECVFLTAGHREALAGLSYSILGRRGFLVLTGDAGTGKTTLLSRVLQRLPAGRVRSSVVLNPTLTAGEFLEMVLLGFGIAEVPPSKPQRLMKIQQLLYRSENENIICALVVDEAQKLSAEILEEIRLLGNFECSDHKLLQILLLGQDELGDVLNRPEMRQLKQRVANRYALKPLSGNEVSDYIGYRWRKAGGAATIPFHPAVLALIAQYSKGIPRVINSICDYALLLAFEDGVHVVESGHIQEACADLQLLTVNSAPKAVPSATLAVPPPVAADIPKSFRGPAPRPSWLARWAGKLGRAAHA